VIVVAVLSLLSHAAPSHWIPAPGVPLRRPDSISVEGVDSGGSLAGKWAAPAPLPDKSVMSEVRAEGAAGDGVAAARRESVT